MTLPTTVARRVAPAVLALGLGLGVAAVPATGHAAEPGASSSARADDCVTERRQYAEASRAEAVARQRVQSTRSAYVDARQRYRDNPTAANRRRMQSAAATYNDALDAQKRAADRKAEARRRLDRCLG